MICVRLIPYIPSRSTSTHQQPSQSSQGGIAVFATLGRSGDEIRAEFMLRGDTETIQWPAMRPQVQLGGELWKHTCFEIFIAETHSRAYWEYNFAPSRAWAMYAFTDYRQPITTAITSIPSIFPPCRTATTFTMPLQFNLEPPLKDKSVSVGVCAVIENQDGSRQYFSLAHCGQRPDFHRRDSFLIKMNG